MLFIHVTLLKEREGNIISLKMDVKSGSIGDGWRQRLVLRHTSLGLHSPPNTLSFFAAN